MYVWYGEGSCSVVDHFCTLASVCMYIVCSVHISLDSRLYREIDLQKKIKAKKQNKEAEWIDKPCIESPAMTEGGPSLRKSEALPLGFAQSPRRREA